MREVQAELGALSARIQEDLGAIQVIKTYGLEERAAHRLRRRRSKRLLDKNMDGREGPDPARRRCSTRSRRSAVAILILSAAAR